MKVRSSVAEWKGARWIVAGMVLVLVAAGAALFWPAPAAKPLPNPNGHDAFVKAGKLVARQTADYQKLPEADLRQLVGRSV